LSKLNWWISGLSGRTGLTPDEIGFFLNTGKMMENARVYAGSFLLQFNDLVQGILGSNPFGDPPYISPFGDSDSAQTLFDFLGKSQLTDIYAVVRSFISDRGWSIPINWLSFLLDGNKPILSF